MEIPLQVLEALKEGFAKYPDSVNIIANVADTYILLGQFDEGIEFMDQAIANNPDIAETYYWKGRLLINKEEVEFIDKAIELTRRLESWIQPFIISGMIWDTFITCRELTFMKDQMWKSMSPPGRAFETWVRKNIQRQSQLLRRLTSLMLIILQ